MKLFDPIVWYNLLELRLGVLIYVFWWLGKKVCVLESELSWNSVGLFLVDDFLYVFLNPFYLVEDEDLFIRLSNIKKYAHNIYYSI